MFFILASIITSKQIHASTDWKDEKFPTKYEVAARYLPELRPAFVVTIVLGLLLIAFELLQMKYSPRHYFRYMEDLFVLPLPSSLWISILVIYIYSRRCTSHSL